MRKKTERRQREVIQWFEAHGLIQEERGEYIDYGIAWSNRSGYDFTT